MKEPKIPDILFQDDEIIIIDKPPFLAVQPGKNIKTTVIDILEKEHNAKLYPVHRLDMDTSGCLVVAKSKESASKYAQLFSDSKTEKKYFAVCSGQFNSNSGVIKEKIEIKGKFKESETIYRVIKKFAKFTLLELKITTGRMHQIRIHLAKTEHPIIGDDKYGNFKLNKEIYAKYKIDNLMLFAHSIKINNKIVKAKLPEHFLNFLKLFNVKL